MLSIVSSFLLLLFKNNRLLFSGNFCGGDKALMEGDKIAMGRSPSHPTKENPRNMYLHSQANIL